VPISHSVIGRAFLAACTPPEREAVLNQMKVKEPEAHRKYRPSIDKSLDDIRLRGFCASTGELRREVYAVGVPMRRTVDGEIVAFNCIVPAFMVKKGPARGRPRAAPGRHGAQHRSIPRFALNYWTASSRSSPTWMTKRARR
jgi:DNA-binding IclR family transcriptional regulator